MNNCRPKALESFELAQINAGTADFTDPALAYDGFKDLVDRAYRRVLARKTFEEKFEKEWTQYPK